jgi:hypothetical protein
VRLVEFEAFIVAAAYLMAGVPVAGVAIMGRVSPNFQLPAGFLFRWWSRFAVPMALFYLGLVASRH